MVPASLAKINITSITQEIGVLTIFNTVCCDVEALAYGYALSGSNPNFRLKIKKTPNESS